MLTDSKAFSGFAVDDLDKARQFYGETLGLNVETLDDENGLIAIHHGGDRDTLAYFSPEMTPPSYTILNFPVDDIDKAVDDLTARGVNFERYDAFDQDDKGMLPRARPRDRLVQRPRREHLVGVGGAVGSRRWGCVSPVVALSNCRTQARSQGSLPPAAFPACRCHAR